jgi:hypothetical protein
MKNDNYKDCVYRLARICEVSDQVKCEGNPCCNEERIRSQLHYWDADQISKTIGRRKKFYFNTIEEYLNNQYGKVKLKEVGAERTKREHREGPIVVFPEVQIKIKNDIYLNRNCNTVCMGENRSKLWVRLSLNNKRKAPEAVRDFYDKAKAIAATIGDAVFYCYKTILEEKGFNVTEVYNINVVGTATINQEVGCALMGLEDPTKTIKELFKDSEALFRSSREVIFPYFGLEKKIINVAGYQERNLKHFDWISVNDPLRDGISIFLSNDSGEGERSSTSFVGLGYYPSKSEKAHLMQKATRDILTLLSPNI